MIVIYKTVGSSMEPAIKIISIDEFSFSNNDSI